MRIMQGGDKVKRAIHVDRPNIFIITQQPFPVNVQLPKTYAFSILHGLYRTFLWNIPS